MLMSASNKDWKRAKEAPPSECHIGDGLGALVDEHLEDVKLAVLGRLLRRAQRVRLDAALRALDVHVSGVVGLGAAIVAAAEDGEQGAAKVGAVARIDAALVLVAANDHRQAVRLEEGLQPCLGEEVAVAAALLVHVELLHRPAVPVA